MFHGPLGTIDGYRGQTVMSRKVALTLHTGCSSPWEYKVLLSPIPGDTLGIDVLQGPTLQISPGQRDQTGAEVKHQLEVSTSADSLPLIGEVTVKQYKLHGEWRVREETAPRKKQEDHNTYNILKAILLRIKGSVISSIMMGSSADC